MRGVGGLPHVRGRFLNGAPARRPKLYGLGPPAPPGPIGGLARLAPWSAPRKKCRWVMGATGDLAGTRPAGREESGDPRGDGGPSRLRWEIVDISLEYLSRSVRRVFAVGKG